MSTTLPKVTARDPLGHAFMTRIESVFDEAGLSEQEAGRIQKAAGIEQLFSTFIKMHRFSNRFKEEETESTHLYPRDYEIKPIAQQVKDLIKIFPELDATKALALIEDELPKLMRPAGAEGWFAIPRWDKIGATYNGAFDVVLARIAQSRNDFQNHRERETSPNHLCQTEHSATAWQRLGEMQKGDILVVPLQLGILHRGRSPRRAREVILDSQGEFALGAFAVGCVALTHPKRFQYRDGLGIDCSGDSFSPNGDGNFSRSLHFFVNAGRFCFDWRSLAAAGGAFGSASGFFPQ